MPSAFVGLAIALAREAELHEFLAHRVGADWMSHRRQRLGELVHALRYPDQRAHGVTKRRRLDKTLQCRSESGVGRADGLAAGARSTHLALGQRSSIQIVLPAINGRTCKAGDPRDHGEAAPACRSHFAGGEQSPAPLIELRADCFPAGPNGIFFNHAIRATTVRPKSESFRPESLGRTLTECDSVIVRSVLSGLIAHRTYKRHWSLPHTGPEPLPRLRRIPTGGRWASDL